MKRKKEETHIDPKMEFLGALDAIAKEKGIDKAGIVEAMELALASAYKKHTGKTNGKARVNPVTGEIKVYSYITVVEEVNNPELEISLEDAKKINKDLEIGDTIDTEVTTEDFGRVAASTAKQVVMQKVREAERQVTLDAFQDKENELLVGTVALEDTDNYFIDLGRSNGILPKKDIIPGEKIEMGSTIKVYVTKVDNSGRNLVIKLSLNTSKSLRKYLLSSLNLSLNEDNSCVKLFEIDSNFSKTLFISVPDTSSFESDLTTLDCSSEDICINAGAGISSSFAFSSSI